MKGRNKSFADDADLNSRAIFITIKRRPTGVKHTTGHHLSFVLWFAGGCLMLGLAWFEMTTSKVYTSIIAMASERIAASVGFDPQSISGMVTRALVEGRSVIITAQLFVAILFFVCAYYSRRLIVRSRYINRLEQAALQENVQVLKEQKPAYAQAEVMKTAEAEVR